MRQNLFLAALLVVLYCEGSLQECKCPKDLLWPKYKMGPKNDQVFCGRELNMLGNSKDCKKETKYSCVVGAAVAVPQSNCGDADGDPKTPFCAPHAEKNCYRKQLKGVDPDCLRARSCQTQKHSDEYYMHLYGKVPT